MRRPHHPLLHQPRWVAALALAGVAALALGAAPLGAIPLPDNSSANSAQPALRVTNTGLGWAGHFLITNPLNANTALKAETNGAGAAHYAYSTGTGRAAIFQIVNTNNNSYALQALTNGRGLAGYFQVTNAANSSPALHGTTSGSGPGVQGNSAGGFGVIGISSLTGVQGVSTGTGGNGVWGDSGAGTGALGSTATGKGVHGNASGTGVGVHGASFRGDGVFGVSLAPRVGSKGTDVGYGVHGRNLVGTGIFGEGNVGIRGQGNNGGDGVHGHSDTGNGVRGESANGDGVLGRSPRATGVRGQGGVGVFAEGSEYGVFSLGRVGILADSTSDNDFAGLFGGNVRINGSLSKSGGSFRIDHPLDPANRTLSHSFVESPDMKNVYDGTVTTDARGDAMVILPDYFEALNRDFRYQLTVIGQFAQAIVATRIQGNRFTIKTDKPNVEVCWQVTGIRQDAWANANRIRVEEEKADKERGLFLHPELHGAPRERGIGWSLRPERMR